MLQLLCLLSSLLLLGHSCASLALNTYALYLRRLVGAPLAQICRLGSSRDCRAVQSSHTRQRGNTWLECTLSDGCRRRGGVLEHSQRKTAMGTRTTLA